MAPQRPTLGASEGSSREAARAAVAPSAKVFAGEERCEWRSFEALDESDFREAYYSYAGGYDQQWVEPGAPRWLEAFRGGGVALVQSAIGASELVGRNTYVEVCGASLLPALAEMQRAIAEGGAGTRVTVVTTERRLDELQRAGFELLQRVPAGSPARGTGGELAWLVEPRVVCCAGRRRGASRECRLDHEAVRAEMDPRDRGEGVEPSSEKAARAWRPVPWEPSRWVGKGLPPEVERLMTEGARIEREAEVSFFEVPQYPWPSEEALAECILEADRGLAIGAYEYVPVEQVEAVLQTETVHPWTCVHQSADKWRACLDVSVGTNRWARSAPFASASSSTAGDRDSVYAKSH